MLTTFCWVPKGAMKAQPILSTDTVEQARSKLRRQNPAYVEEDTETRTKKGGGALRRRKGDRTSATSDTDDYDEGGEANEELVADDMLRDIAGGGTGAILEQVESEDEDEIEDITFKETDLAFCVAAADPDAPRVELYTYDEPEDNMFLHHDMEIAAFPLCSSWLTDGTMSMLAVGTMLPFIEIWALDVMDSVEPAVILGGCEKADYNYDKRKLKKNLKADSHKEAVLAVKWNTVAQNVLASGSADHTIKLWDLGAGGTCLGTYSEGEKVQSLDWHPSEANLLLSGGFDATAVLRDCRHPQQAAARFTLPGVVEHVEFAPLANNRAPESSLVFASTSNGVLAAFDTRNASAPLWSLTPHDGETTFSCSRQVPGLFATGGKEGKITLWDGRRAWAEAPTEIVTRAYKTGAVLCIAFHPNSPHILGACGSGGEPLVYTITADVQTVFA